MILSKYPLRSASVPGTPVECRVCSFIEATDCFTGCERTGVGVGEGTTKVDGLCTATGGADAEEGTTKVDDGSPNDGVGVGVDVPAL